jgi:hypothetical protein
MKEQGYDVLLQPPIQFCLAEKLHFDHKEVQSDNDHDL